MSDESPKPTTKRKYIRAIGPRLRILLHLVFVLAALLTANGVYLASITAIEWATGRTYQNFFYQYMFLGHLAIGLLFVVPFVAFGIIHLVTARTRKNKRAIRLGYFLFAASLVILVSGILLLRVAGFDLKQPGVRRVVYWLHVLSPVAAVWLYWLHRLVGQKIQWRLGIGFAGATAVAVGAMVAFHTSDPRDWNAVGPVSGTKYFEPSLARTTSGNFIPANALMNDDYCKKCHPDSHAAWVDSVHHFSSFNNPPYHASVNEAREVAFERDGNVQATRFCAGCHDPVPFFSGAFDDPKFDTVKHETAKAGITCTACHAITHINSNRGNADYTIEEPLHYPFAYSDNEVLQWVNNQLVKAKPSFHKKTFLKPHHKTAEFCGACHKVHLPFELNKYKEFLRGQNHYDSYLLSGVSGHGLRSFYYPPEAETNCNRCHMPLQESNEFGAAYNTADMRPGSTFNGPTIHNHMFPSANTGIAWLRETYDVIEAHKDFNNGVMRVDVFGIREGGEIDGKLTAPLRPEVPELVPGETYLLETVIRTLKMGHHFTQGTIDSNEIWLDVTVTSGDKVIGRSGAIDESKANKVDPWSHFVNAFVIDKDGNRISRRNAQDIFTPLYNNQIPPGAGQAVHYELAIPDEVDAPITVEVKLQYRKFDQLYMDFVAKKTAALGEPIRGYTPEEPYRNDLPIMTLATDRITFPVKGISAEVSNAVVEFPEWQRWNDYGIGLLLKGKAQLRQAAEAFQQVEGLKRWDGPLNLARVYNSEGRLDDAVAALQRAQAYAEDPMYPSWTWAWLSGDINRQQGYLEEAANNLRTALDDNQTQARLTRKFDFSKDYMVRNLLGQTLFDLGEQRSRQGLNDDAMAYWQQAVKEFQQTLAVDSENVTAHRNLQTLYSRLGDETKAAEHFKLHQIYKSDDNATDRAVRLAREKYPAANKAAEAVVKYSLHRSGATGQTVKTSTATSDNLASAENQERGSND